MAAKNATKQGKIGETVAKGGQDQFKNKQKYQNESLKVTKRAFDKGGWSESGQSS